MLVLFCIWLYSTGLALPPVFEFSVYRLFLLRLFVSEFSVYRLFLLCFSGYWLGGRPSAAVPRESARKRADSARFRADPANFRQTYFSAYSAERPANVRRTLADSARIRADPRGVRRELAEEFTRKMSADKNLSYTSAPRGRTSAADDRPPRKY